MSKLEDGTAVGVGEGAPRWIDDGTLSVPAIRTDCGSLSMATDELRKSSGPLLASLMNVGSSEENERFVHKSSWEVKSGYSEGSVRKSLLSLLVGSSGEG